MTVKEIVSVLKEAKKVRLGYGGTVQDVDLDDKLMMDALKSYKVRAVYALAEDEIEIDIAMRPVVEG